MCLSTVCDKEVAEPVTCSLGYYFGWGSPDHTVFVSRRRQELRRLRQSAHQTKAKLGRDDRGPQSFASDFKLKRPL